MRVHDAGNYLYSRFYMMEWDADCNRDGIVGFGQILRGQIADNNHNNIPDGPAVKQQPLDQYISVGNNVSFIFADANSHECVLNPWCTGGKRNPVVMDENANDAWIDLNDNGNFLQILTDLL
jgi:hypothetical protein